MSHRSTMVVILLVRKWLSGATWTLICLKNGIYHNLTLFATKVDIKEKCSDGAVCYRPTPLTHTTSFEDKSFILMVNNRTLVCPTDMISKEVYSLTNTKRLTSTRNAHKSMTTKVPIGGWCLIALKKSSNNEF